MYFLLWVFKSNVLYGQLKKHFSSFIACVIKKIILILKWGESKSVRKVTLFRTMRRRRPLCSHLPVRGAFTVHGLINGNAM